MYRASGVLCACLAGLAGCAFNVGNTRVDVAVKVDEQAIDARVEDAAARLKAELEKRGLRVEVSERGNALRVESQTKAGDAFAVDLIRARTPEGKEQTKARVSWSASPDRELWLALVLAAGEAALEARR